MNLYYFLSNLHDTTTFQTATTFWTGCTNYALITLIHRGPGSSRYSDRLWAGQSGNRIPVGATFSAPVQTRSRAHPTSCTMGTRSFPGVKSGWGVTLTPHPLLVPWLTKSRAIPLLPLWAVQPVQSLSACTRVHFTLLYCHTHFLCANTTFRCRKWTIYKWVMKCMLLVHVFLGNHSQHSKHNKCENVPYYIPAMTVATALLTSQNNQPVYFHLPIENYMLQDMTFLFNQYGLV